MDAIFTPIDPETWARKPYFDYFINVIKCRYALTVNIDITDLRKHAKDRGKKFFPTFLYAVMRAVNQNREFRLSFNANGDLGYWNFLNPVYTIFHEDDKTFSDIWSEWDEDFAVFHKTMVTDMETYKNVKGIKARPDQPANFCSVSSLPWLSFTGFAQDTYQETKQLFPITRFGKYFEERGRTLIPFALFIHHAVADGYHSSKLINDVQALAAGVKDWMG